MMRTFLPYHITTRIAITIQHFFQPYVMGSKYTVFKMLPLCGLKGEPFWRQAFPLHHHPTRLFCQLRLPRRQPCLLLCQQLMRVT